MQIRGALYRKLTAKEELPKTRAGQMLRLMKKNGSLSFYIKPVKGLITIPGGTSLAEKGMTYPLIAPYAIARIIFDQKDEQLTYNVVEPKLSEKETSLLHKIKEGFIQMIDVRLEDIEKKETLMKFLENNVKKILDSLSVKTSETEYSKIMYYIYRDYVGLNRIEPLLADPFVEDVGCDGVGIPVYIVHQKLGSMRTSIIYTDEKELKEFVTKLAERCDRYISYAEPLLDGSLKDGTRVQASLTSDVTTRGPTFSLRKFKEEPFSPPDMVRLNTASSEMMAYLWYVVERGANILISGGVSTGKTSFLNSISIFIPPEAKIISIEDTRELSLPHENWIPGVSRMGFTGTGTGEVTMFELLKESFRQNPDYLIVGEVRSKEAYVMFQGMSSGHPSMSTMHAGSVDDLMKRLQTKPISLSPGLLESLDIVIIMIHARDKGKSSRRVKEIVEIRDIDKETGAARTNKAFTWLPSSDEFEYKGGSWVLTELAKESGTSMNDVIREVSKRKAIIEWMLRNNITRMEEVAKYIYMYHRDPAKFERILRGDNEPFL